MENIDKYIEKLRSHNDKIHKCNCEIKGSDFELDNGTILCCKCEKER